MALPVADVFRGQNVFVRPPDPSDYPHMYHLETVGWASQRWRFAGQIPSFDGYVQMLWANVYSQVLIVETGGTERPLGLATAYNPNALNGFVSLAAIRYLEGEQTGPFLEGVLIFVRHLFASTTFRKLYLEVAEYNMDQFGRGIRRHFVQEGRFGEHLWHDGQFWDLFTFSLSRDRWLELEARVRGSIL